MKIQRLLRSRAALVLALAADLLLHSASAGPYGLEMADFERALAVQAAFTDDWLSLDGVVGTAVGMDASGVAVVKVYLEAPVPSLTFPTFAGVDVVTEVTGPFRALPAAEVEAAADVDPKGGFPRPVPIGVSTGHPSVTAGTIGARVTDGARVFALSNNHILAANNSGRRGDNFLQPGRADGGRDPDDALGTLHDFEPLHLCGIVGCPSNRIDAAIALTSTEDLGGATPEGGYGAPRSRTVEAELGATVQKYGRTTGHTVGEITGVHATLDVRYPSGVARFEGQIVISGNGFSAGGDSGSLVVTKGVLLGDRRPVGLLFAGTGTSTVANPIDLVLDRFGVRVDGG